MRTIKTLFIAACLLVLVSAPASAAWSIIARSETNCTTCGAVQSDRETIIFRVKITSDGTTSTAAENLLIPSMGYNGYFLYAVDVENPAAGGPSGAWNLELQDAGVGVGTTGKVIIEEDAVDNTASAVISINGNDKTGKFEKIIGQLRLIVDDTDMANTEYTYLLFTFVK